MGWKWKIEKIYCAIQMIKSRVTILISGKK